MMETFFIFGNSTAVKGNQAQKMEQIPRREDFVRLDDAVYLVTRVLWVNDQGYWQVIVYVDALE